MKRADLIPNKIFESKAIVFQVNAWRLLNKKIAFSNGVFDIIHQGHIYSLTQAAAEADTGSRTS